MFKPLFRGSRAHPSLAMVVTVCAVLAMVVMTLRIVDHGLAFGRWLAALNR